MSANALDRRIAKICRKDSYFWMFLQPDGLDRSADHEVEVRLNIPPRVISELAVVPGWTVAHVNASDGMLFLRRFQPLTDRALRAMFADAVTIAAKHSGNFHSWIHTDLDFVQATTRP